MSDEAQRSPTRVPESAESVAARESCLADIRQHLESHGPRDRKIVQARHPNVPDRRFWRYVAQVRGTGAKVKNYTPDPESIRNAIQTMTKRAEIAEAKTHIPRPPPAIIAAGGIEARRKLDFLEHLDGMLSDCDMLREYSMREDPETGKKKIHNPMYFTQSIKLRAEVLNTAISAMKALWDIQRMQNFYDVIVHEVTKLDASTGRAIMERLQELDAQRGMTMNATL